MRQDSTKVNSISKTRCLGLIGGLGIGAGIYYYEKLARALEAHRRTPDIVMAHASTPRVFAYVQAGDRQGLAEYLNSFIRRLQAAGAELAAVPAVTAHFSVRELIALSPLPVLNIFDPLVRALTARSARRVALFGTRYVIESGLFGQVPGVEIVKPDPAEVDYIHNTYVELARTGRPLEGQHRGLTALAHTLVARDEVDAIILAGTDLALLFNESNTSFPCVDCAALHMQTILRTLLDETPPSSG